MVVVVLDVLESIFKMFLSIVTVDTMDQRPWCLVQFKVKDRSSHVMVYNVTIVEKLDISNVIVSNLKLMCKVVNKMLVVVKNSCIAWLVVFQAVVLVEIQCMKLVNRLVLHLCLSFSSRYTTSTVVY